MYDECPRCNFPLNGQTCRKCGLNPHEEDIVWCDDCGDPTLAEECETYTYQTPISARTKVKEYCPDCQ